MNVSLYIARRYLFAKKSRNAINIISLISALAVMVGTTALVVVLSVFNGFDDVIKSLISAFEPDLHLSFTEGKVFDPEEAGKTKILAIPGVEIVSGVLEENALVRYDDRQFIATMKGVDESYAGVTGIDTMMREGEFVLRENGKPQAVVGQGVAYSLHVGLNFIQPLIFYVPSRTSEMNMLNPSASVNRMLIFPSGIFSIEQDYDNRYILLPIEPVRQMLEYSNEVSALEIKLAGNADQEEIQEEIKKIAGARFEVKNRFEQNEVFYRIMKSEKWATFLILTLILIIASFNIIGSLTMLIIDKKDDINTLRNLGASDQLIRKIFLLEGWLISIIGSFAGILLGTAISLAQENFGIIRIGGSGTFVIDAYPVNVQIPDILLIWITVLLLGFIAAWLPANRISAESLKSVVRED